MNMRHFTFSLYDDSRSRRVPIAIYAPHGATKGLRPVLFSPGYDKHPEENAHAYTDYNYLGKALAEEGCVMASVQCHLESDAPLSMEHPYICTRMSDWLAGAETMEYAATTLRLLMPHLDWEKAVIMGHSNGGDLSSLLFQTKPDLFSALITLDNRRYPLPDKGNVLTLRGCDFTADPGVLPSNPNHINIVGLTDTKHSDIGRFGTNAQHERIAAVICDFLKNISVGHNFSLSHTLLLDK